MQKDEKIVFLSVITMRETKDAVIKALLKTGIHLIKTSYGKGGYNAGYLSNTLALVPEKNRAVISCVTKDTKANAVLDMLCEKFNFGESHTGIAYTVAIDKISF